MVICLSLSGVVGQASQFVEQDEHWMKQCTVCEEEAVLTSRFILEKQVADIVDQLDKGKWL